VIGRRSPAAVTGHRGRAGVVTHRGRATVRVRRGDDAGSAVVEFVALGVLMLVPLVYLVLTLGRVQAAAFAADGAARAAARAFVLADDEATGRARALAAVRLGLRDQGFDDDPATAGRVSCSAAPCLTPQGRVSVEVSVRVVLPGLPAMIDRVASAHVTVRAAHIASVDTFRPTAAVR
jgi:hypothetical protein